MVVVETHDTEENGENDETTELERLATNGIDSSYSKPCKFH
jgi:hypothetical protein